MLNTINSSNIRRVSALVNAVVASLVLLCVFLVVNWSQMPGGLGGFLAMRITIKNILVVAICLTSAGASFYMFGMAVSASGLSFKQEVLKVTKACTLTTAFAFLFPLTSHSGVFTTRILLYFLPSSIVACLVGRFVARLIAERFARRPSSCRDLLIVGSGSRAASLYDRLRGPGISSFRILGFVDSPDGHSVREDIRQQIVGSLEDLEVLLMRHAVDEVLIALPAESCFAQIQRAITVCERAGVEAKYLFTDIFELSLAKPRVEPHGELSVVSLKVVHDDERLLVKRAIDVAGAIVGLMLFGPLMFLIAALIRLTSPGPALFVQERYGLRKRRFMMYKFRTMVINAEKLQAGLELQNEVKGPAFKIRDDPRVTPLGRFLRKTSIDELPQLFNVLSGDMSLVGPRPLPARDVSRFDNVALMRRFSVKPGLTCLWQINGRSNTDFDQWIEMDLRYIDTWSLSLDLEILAKTFPSVLAGRGAS